MIGKGPLCGNNFVTRRQAQSGPAPAVGDSTALTKENRRWDLSNRILSIPSCLLYSVERWQLWKLLFDSLLVAPFDCLSNIAIGQLCLPPSSSGLQQGSVSELLPGLQPSRIYQGNVMHQGKRESLSPLAIINGAENVSIDPFQLCPHSLVAMPRNVSLEFTSRPLGAF